MMSDRNKNTAAVILLNAVITILFISAQDFSAGSFRGYLISGIIGAGLMIILPFCVWAFSSWNEAVSACLKQITKAVGAVRAHPKRTAASLFLYACAAAVSWLITTWYSSGSFNLPMFHMIFALSSIAVTVFALWNVSGQYPQVLFAGLMLISGLYFINASPVELGVTWDDDAHYERSLSIVSMPSGILYEADDVLYEKQAETALSHFGYAEEEREERTELLNTLYAQKAQVPYVYKGMGKFAVFSYLPFAFGMTMGRGLHLSYTMIFRLGKLANLLTYIAIIMYAMSRLEAGKILLGTIAMVPTLTFMASTYSYDPWVCGWMMLGFAVFFSYLQKPLEKMRNRDILLICFSFLMGCLPKAVYCVVMLPLLFMPKDRFVSKRQHLFYLLCGFLTVGLLAGTFVLPRLMHGMGTGDARGGSEVNATEQMNYILEDPVRILGVLKYFLTSTYLVPRNAVQYMESYAYLGINGSAWMTPLIVLVTAFMDRNGKHGKTAGVCIASLTGVILGVLIVAFTFYLSYTPVGYHTVLGCQFRYLLPMVFPFLYIIGTDRVKNPLPSSVFNVLPMLWMACSFVLYTGMFMIRMY